jgi:hypothetical protein
VFLESFTKRHEPSHPEVHPSQLALRSCALICWLVWQGILPSVSRELNKPGFWHLRRDKIQEFSRTFPGHKIQFRSTQTRATNYNILYQIACRSNGSLSLFKRVMLWKAKLWSAFTWNVIIINNINIIIYIWNNL